MYFYFVNKKIQKLLKTDKYDILDYKELESDLKNIKDDNDTEDDFEENQD